MRKPRRIESTSRNPNPPVVEGLEDRRLLSASFGNGASLVGGILSGLGIPAGGDFHFGHHQVVVGTVVSTNTTADTITVSNPANSSSSPTTYTLASNATITADGTATTLASLLAGAQVELQLSTANSTTTVTSVSAISQFAEGVVSSVDITADTITITGFSGTATTYPLSSTAKITLDGSSSTLGALAAGDDAQLTLSALDGMTVTNISARSAPTFQHHGVSQHVTGTVVSVDTTGDTITISMPSDGSATQTMYTVDPSATITADGTATTLGSLMAGAHVVLTVSSTSATTATAIAAYSQNVSGTVSSVNTTADTITLTEHGSAGTTYTVGSSATVDINGATAALSGIATGSLADLTLSAFDAKTVTNIDDHTIPPILHGLGVVHAVVVSVDTSADTITVSTNSQGTSTQTTYTVDPSATITANGATTALSSLSAGADVVLQISSTSSTTVTSIAAVSQIVTGTVSSFNTTADTITITSHDGTATTYPVSSTATVTINGATGTLAGISDGSRVVMQLSALDGMTVTEIWVGTAGQNNNQHPQSEQLPATVVSVDTSADTITVSVTKMGATTQVTYTLSSSATITADGSATSLGSLLAGAHVILQLSTSSSTTTVTSIKALSTEVEGSVSSVNTSADTITITNRGGTSTTYTLGSSATITLNGATGTLGALTSGTRVNLTLSALDGATVTSIVGITPGMIVHHHRAQGTVVSVDTSADTITISNNVGGAPTNTTYTLSPTATITANGSTATLGDLSAGAIVVLQLETTGTMTTGTTTVTSIVALPQRASGVISSVDTTADTITITPRNSTTTQTYTLASTASVTLNGAASTLGSLTSGEHVRLQLSALDGMTVLSIRANGS